MAKCKNEALLSKIGVHKLNKQMEVTFEVLNDLPDCKKINTKNYISLTGTSVVAKYNTFDRPENVFECMPKGCKNTGTLVLTGTSPAAVYKIPYDAREFASGIITFYVKNTGSAAATVTASIGDVADYETNADVYSFSAPVGGFSPIVIDLSKEPDSETGDGWTATDKGAILTISVPSGVGISSIAVFDQIEDFETSSVVKIGCLSSVGGTIDLDVAAMTCWDSGYDTSELPTIEETITGNSASPNYWRLNPMLRKGNATRKFKIVTVEKQLVVSGDYAIANLPDAYAEECGFVGSNIADSCNFTDALLERLTVPVGVDVDQKHFIVGANDDGGITVYYSTDLAGQTVMISYPKAVDVEERIADAQHLDEVRTRMFYNTKLTDGTEVVRVYDNVLVTSFPQTITEEETEFSFTVNLQPDANGEYYHEYRVLD